MFKLDAKEAGSITSTERAKSGVVIERLHNDSYEELFDKVCSKILDRAQKGFRNITITFDGLSLTDKDKVIQELESLNYSVYEVSNVTLNVMWKVPDTRTNINETRDNSSIDFVTKVEYEEGLQKLRGDFYSRLKDVLKLITGGENEVEPEVPVEDLLIRELGIEIVKADEDDSLPGERW